MDTNSFQSLVYRIHIERVTILSIKVGTECTFFGEKEDVDSGAIPKLVQAVAVFPNTKVVSIL